MHMNQQYKTSPRKISAAAVFATPPQPSAPITSRHASTPNSYVNLSFPDQDVGLFSLPSAEVTKEEILFVSEKLIKWQIFVRNLFQDTGEDVDHLIAELEDEKETKRLKLQDVCARVLNEWKKRLGREATFQCLFFALRKTGRKDLCQELQERRFGSGSGYVHFQSPYSSRASSLSSYVSNSRYAWNAYSHPYGTPGLARYGSCSSAHSFVICQPDEEDAFGNQAFGKDEAIYFQVPNEQRLPEVGELKKALLDPSKKIISLAGHINSGKTIIIDILHREIKESVGFERAKIIKIQAPDQKDIDWLTRRILESITNESWLESNYTKSVVKHLVGILDTDTYDDILLILDISLIPNSKNGQEIVEFLCELVRQGKLQGKLTICISSLCSLWNSKLFSRDRTKSYEVVVRTMGHDEAVKFMTDVNPNFSRQVASRICKKIECVPFVLKSIAETDIKHFFAAESKEELLKAIDCKLDDLIENVCSGVIGKETLEIVFNCLDDKQKSLLAQVLPFSSEFDVERAARIVDSHISISDISLNCFCEKGALFFSSKLSKSSNTKVYMIPAMLGKLLRSIVQDDDGLREQFDKAEKRHQKLFHNLLLHMSSCFMGDLPSKNEELRMLEPFTPSDGVPAKLSITIDDTDERVKRVVSLFRRHVGDIKNSLKVSNSSIEKYKAALAVATNLRVYYLFSKLLRFHEALEIYRNLKRKARNYENLDVEKLNVFIAAFYIDAYGYKWYSSEAKSLLEASFVPLRKGSSGEHTQPLQESSAVNATEIYAYCVCRFGTCLLAEGVMNDDEKRDNLFCQGIELIGSSNEIFQERLIQKQSYMANVADSYRILAGFQLENGNIDDALALVNEKCLKICSECYGSHHPLTCNCKRLLGKIYRKLEKYEDAKNVLLEVFDAEQQLLGEHSDTAKTVSELGLCCLEEFKALEEEKGQQTLKAPEKNESSPRLRLSLYGTLDNAEQSEWDKDASGNVNINENQRTEVAANVTCRCGLNCDGRCLEEHKTDEVTPTPNSAQSQHENAPQDVAEGAEETATQSETAICKFCMKCICNCKSLIVERRETLLRFNSSSTASLYEAKLANENNQQNPVKTADAADIQRSDGNANYSTKKDSWKRLETADTELRYDLLIDAKSYFKKAARYSLHVVGKRDDACENLEHLAEVCGLSGDEEQKQKWLQRAEEYRQCIIR